MMKKDETMKISEEHFTAGAQICFQKQELFKNDAIVLVNKFFFCPSNSIILIYGFSVICFIFHEQPQANDLCIWTLLARLTMRVKLIFNLVHS